jgi:hypothetical protein
MLVMLYRVLLLIHPPIEHFRASMLSLISNSYTSITPALANIYLGIDLPKSTSEKEAYQNSDHVIEVLNDRGWHWDVARGLLIPMPVSSGTEDSTTTGHIARGQNKMASMDRLVQLVGFLGD